VKKHALVFLGATLFAFPSLGQPCTTTPVFIHTFESATGLGDYERNWFDDTHALDWRGVQACSALSGTKIFRFGGVGCTANYSNDNFAFVQPRGATGIAIPAGSRDTRLIFAHRWRFEPGFDGGTLMVSFDKFIYFTVPPEAFLMGATYNGTIPENGCHTFGAAGQPVFTGVQSAFLLTTVDLDFMCRLTGPTGCAGRTIWVAFAAITDCSVTDDGWFLDNVRVTTCK
jgi:hypothetical protein